ncbi:hypothetical protein D3C71_1643760 [compost metagenome]
MAEGDLACVESDDQVGRLMLFNQAQQHRREAVDRIGLLARRVRQRRHGEECPVDHVISIY